MFAETLASIITHCVCLAFCIGVSLVYVACRRCFWIREQIVVPVPVAASLPVVESHKPDTDVVDIEQLQQQQQQIEMPLIISNRVLPNDHNNFVGQQQLSTVWKWKPKAYDGLVIAIIFAIASIITCIVAANHLFLMMDVRVKPTEHAVPQSIDYWICILDLFGMVSGIICPFVMVQQIVRTAIASNNSEYTREYIEIE